METSTKVILGLGVFVGLATALGAYEHFHASPAGGAQKVTLVAGSLSVSAPTGGTIEFDLPAGATWASDNKFTAGTTTPPTSGSMPLTVAVPSGYSGTTQTVTASWLDSIGAEHQTSISLNVTT